MIRNGENMILEDIQTKKITGKEIYGIYQPDICYVNRDGIERTLQILRKNAEKFNIDPENIFLMGDFSGGNTAFITAFSYIRN